METPQVPWAIFASDQSSSYFRMFRGSTTEKSLATSCLHPPCRCFVHSDKILLSLLYSRLNNHSSPSLSSYVSDPSPSISFFALACTRPSTSTLVLDWGPTGGWSTPDVASSVLSTGAGSPPLTCWQPRIPSAASATRAHCSASNDKTRPCRSPFLTNKTLYLKDYFFQSFPHLTWRTLKLLN